MERPLAKINRLLTAGKTALACSVPPVLRLTIPELTRVPCELVDENF